jgi:hypothetical protein
MMNYTNNQIIWEHNKIFFFFFFGSLIVYSNVELKLIELLHGASVKWENQNRFFFFILSLDMIQHGLELHDDAFWSCYEQ